MLYFPKKGNPLKGKSVLIDDEHLTKKNYTEKDKLGYSEFAMAVKIIIETSQAEKSLSIGITGSWGSGKTSFLEILEDKLSEDKNIVIIKFNPWKSSTPSQFTHDYFQVLAEKLPFHDFPSQIRDYGTLVSNFDQTGWTKLFIGIIDSKSSIETEYEKMDTIFQKLNRKVVVLIDDMDRMNKDEILAIFRLVRNTADFPNTIYVLAYDPEYINNQIKEYDSKQDHYIDKIINLPITLPLPDQSFYFGWLHSEAKCFSQKWEEIKYNNIIDYLYCIKLVYNFRRAKKIFNSYQIVKNYLNKSVKNDQLLLISMIKAYDDHIFKKLIEVVDKEANISKSTRLVKEMIDEKEGNDKFQSFFESFKRSMEDTYPEREVVLSFIKHFIEIQNDDLSFIKKPERYLKLNLTGYTPLEVMNLFTESKENIDNELEKISKNTPIIFENKRERLYNDLLDKCVKEVTNTEILNLFLDKVFDYGSKIENPYSGTLAIKLLEIYQKAKDIFDEASIAKLKENLNIKNGTNIYFIGGMLQQFLRNYCNQEQDAPVGQETLIIPKTEFTEIALKNLDYVLLSESTSFDQKIFSLHVCFDSIEKETNKVIFHADALTKFKEYVEEYPDEFIETLIRPVMWGSPENNYTFYPFSIALFGNIQDFRNFIEQHTKDNKKLEYVMAEKYLEKYLKLKEGSTDPYFDIEGDHHDYLQKKFNPYLKNSDQSEMPDNIENNNEETILENID